jgi:putative transport protein
MEWFFSLLLNDGIAHTILLFAFVISLGILLGKVKFFGISLGVTFVLFVGLFVGHLGLSVNPEVLEFIKNFGLILFVYSIGLQVGPSFFTSFKKGGMLLNLLSTIIVLLGVGIVIALYYLLHGKVSMPMLVGILSGSVTNTPGLGAAQEALQQVYGSTPGGEIPPIALGYAVAYPIGVLGIIFSMILLRIFFKIDFHKEKEQIKKSSEVDDEQVEKISVQVKNDKVFNHTVREVKRAVGRPFIVSRLMRNGEFFIPQGDSMLYKDDILLVVAASRDIERIASYIGEKVEMDWKISEEKLVSRRIVITHGKINGKTIGSLKLRTIYGVNITRVNRSGVDLLGTPDLVLQVGDRVMVVGELEAIEKVEKLLGNTLQKLNEPPIITIFVGILLGVLVGSIPFFVPGIPIPVKLGLAGGPLIVAILIGRFGYKLKLITYTTTSANYMLREIGISLFLASVGIGAGEKFVETVISANGLLWMGCAAVISLLPLLIVGIIGRKLLKINYFTLIGLLAGSTTDPPALAYSNSIAGSDIPAVAYSTVYPLTMFLRVVSAQVLILAFI